MQQVSLPLFALLALVLLACESTSPVREEPLESRLVASRRSPEVLFELRTQEPGRVHLVFPAPRESSGSEVLGTYLYVSSLHQGLGANDVGLDRGQLATPQVVRFRVVGDRVLLEALNTGFRAETESPLERLAAEQSFATSVLWAGEVQSSEGEVVFDATSLVVRDAHGAVRALRDSGQGEFSVDTERSVLDASQCVALPENVELGAILTLACEEPGPEVRRTTPVATAVTLHQHHSFVRLPDDGYRARAWDPRSGSFVARHVDMAAGIGETNVRQLASRFRLERKNERGEVVKPIVYYVDRGAPEPIRSALVEGASWWAEAFEAAGFVDAFRVEVLPEGVHPLDTRYNVIQWVHRSTRGWSYGGGLEDPRTGERILGRVSLGSLRVRQDRLLFEGLLGAQETGSGSERDPIELSLARLRQLSAHEVGHTLGLAHNFAGSACGRSSVMDYPAPLVTVDAGGDLDVSRAYATGVGEWDRLAIRWLYSEFETARGELEGLESILSEAVGRGLRYYSDADARPAGAALSAASLWDNGEDPVLELESVLAVRAVALRDFGERNLAPGRPLAELEEVLIPLYFHHRYQLEAAAKRIGGVEWRHTLSGELNPGVRPVSGAEQARALEALLETTSPAVLDVPEGVLDLLPPRPPSTPRHRELAASETLPVFDALGVAETAARMTFDRILQPQRCARLLDQARRDPSIPGLQAVLEQCAQRVFATSGGLDRRELALQQAAQRAFTASLIDLGRSPMTPARVRAVAEFEQRRLRDRFREDDESPHRAFLWRCLDRALEGEEDPLPIRTNTPPPGSPIGCGSGLADDLGIDRVGLELLEALEVR